MYAKIDRWWYMKMLLKKFFPLDTNACTQNPCQNGAVCQLTGLG